MGKWGSWQLIQAIWGSSALAGRRCWKTPGRRSAPTMLHRGGASAHALYACHTVARPADWLLPLVPGDSIGPAANRHLPLRKEREMPQGGPRVGRRETRTGKREPRFLVGTRRRPSMIAERFHPHLCPLPGRDGGRERPATPGAFGELQGNISPTPQSGGAPQPPWLFDAPLRVPVSEGPRGPR